MVVCADEREGARLAQDLAAFAGVPVPILGSRDFTFHNAASVSRQWEHRRLSLLRQLAAGAMDYEVPLSAWAGLTLGGAGMALAMAVLYRRRVDGEEGTP